MSTTSREKKKRLFLPDLKKKTLSFLNLDYFFRGVLIDCISFAAIPEREKNQQLKKHLH
jgi:hypothetical protein